MDFLHPCDTVPTQSMYLYNIKQRNIQFLQYYEFQKIFNLLSIIFFFSSIDLHF